MTVDPRIEAAAKAMVRCSVERQTSDAYVLAVAAIAAADKAATINTVEGLDGLPVGSRVVMGEYLILRDAEVVDDGVWIDLGNGLRLDSETLGRILASYPAHVIRWGPA